MSIRDHLSALRWQAAKGRVKVSNAWYRTAGRRVHGARGGTRNWMNQRALDRGRAPLPDRMARPVHASLPVHRNRINPATGRPHREDLDIGRANDRNLARRRAALRAGKARMERERRSR